MKNQKINIFFTQRAQKWFFHFLLFIFLFGWLWLASFFYWIHHLPKEYNGMTAEAIIILTGAKGRLSAGTELLKEKKAKALLISGVNAQLSDRALFYQMPSMSQQLKKRVSVGKEASNTIGNAIEAKVWMEEKNYQSAIIVTSNWHMDRAMLELRHVMEDKSFIAYPVLSDKQIEKGKFWYFSKD